MEELMVEKVLFIQLDLFLAFGGLFLESQTPPTRVRGALHCTKP